MTLSEEGEHKSVSDRGVELTGIGHTVIVLGGRFKVDITNNFIFDIHFPRLGAARAPYEI